MCGRVAISSTKWFSAMRSGACATNTSWPIVEAALLLEVAGHELGRAGRDGRAQHEHVTARAAPAAASRAPCGCPRCRSRCARGSACRASARCSRAVGRVLDPVRELQPAAGPARGRAAPACPRSWKGITPARNGRDAVGVPVDADRRRGRGRRSSARAAARRGRGRRPRRRARRSRSHVGTGRLRL